MPAWHHSEYSTPICPLTKSTIKKLYTPMPGYVRISSLWTGSLCKPSVKASLNSRAGKNALSTVITVYVYHCCIAAPSCQTTLYTCHNWQHSSKLIVLQHTLWCTCTLQAKIISSNKNNVKFWAISAKYNF